MGEKYPPIAPIFTEDKKSVEIGAHQWMFLECGASAPLWQGEETTDDAECTDRHGFLEAFLECDVPAPLWKGE